MFPKWLSNVQKYFMIWGFCTTSSVSYNYKLLNISIFLLHLILCTWCSFNCLKSFIRLRIVINFLDAFNFLVFYVNCCAAYWFIIFDFFTKRQVPHTFWANLQRINKEPKLTRQRNSWRCFIVSIKLLSIINILVWLIVLVADDLSNFNDKIMFLILICVVDHRIFFYLFHLKLIACELQRIHSKLIDPKIKNYSETQLKSIRKSYKLVYEMSANLNVIFGISQLTLIMLNFQSYVTFINFIYRHISGHIYSWNSGLFGLLKCYNFFDSINFSFPFDFLFIDLLGIAKGLMIFRISSHMIFFNKYSNDCYALVNIFENVFSKLGNLRKTEHIFSDRPNSF